MKYILKLFRWILRSILFIIGITVIVAIIISFAVVVAYPNLPSIEAVTDYQPKIPLRVYSADGFLIGEFGEERRAFVKIEDVPEAMKQAILAAEDARFYQHSGVDYIGVMRAAYANFVGGARRQGASTITMQVARNFFLSKEKTLTRKFFEVLLAFKIENNLSKDEILQIYINQIYLGQRAFGFAAAAQVYFGKSLQELNVAEMAILAGLPRAPSTFNPVVNLPRAKTRQLYILRRMHEFGFINDQQFAEAQKMPINVRREGNELSTKADYLAEMVRQVVYEKYRDDTYSKGISVYTTIIKRDQDAAYEALRKGVLDYDRRHGYRGPEAYLNLPETGADQDELLEELLSDFADSDDIFAAIVLQATPKTVKAYRRGGGAVNITGEGLKFAQKMLENKAPPNKKIRRGAIIRIQKDEKNNWHIIELPEVEAAFISINPANGAIRSLVGGFDFGRNKFNHVTQAWRQPGSSFKPFIYSAALEKGFSPATVINDEQILVDANETGGQVWEPKNYDDKYAGPIRTRTALMLSKNIVSIRIVQAITPQYAQDYIKRFGFDTEKHPPYLTIALGAGVVTPWQAAGAYSVFANGGYKIDPYFIERIIDNKGNVLMQSQPSRAGDETLRVIDARNAFLMDSMMRDVVRAGTGARAMQLGRRDLAGKTGTTNDFVDAWFSGYQSTLVAVAWIGYDQPRRLGMNETGSVAALPIWMDYMGKVLKDVPESLMPVPPGIVSVRINADTGLRSNEGKLIWEYFYAENVPPEERPKQGITDGGTSAFESFGKR